MNLFISTKGTQDGYSGQLLSQQRQNTTDSTYGQMWYLLSCSYTYFGRKLYFIGISLGLCLHKSGKHKCRGNYNTLKMLSPILCVFCKHASLNLN